MSTQKIIKVHTFWQRLFAKDAEDRRDRKRLLYSLFFIFFAIEAILFINDLIQLPCYFERWVTVFVSVSSVLAILILLLRKHYINLSSILLIAGFWLLITAFAYSSGGIFTNLTRGYMVITFLAGLLGGVAFGGLVGLLSILADLSFIYFGDLIPPPIARSSSSQWLINTFNIVIVILLQAHFIKNLKGAHRHSNELAQQHKQVEENLVESEERFRAVYDQTDIGVILFDRNARISNVNQAFCKLFGYSRQEIEGSRYSLFTNESLNQNERQISNEMAAGERLSYTIERYYARKDKSKVPVSVTVSLLRDREGNAASYLCFITDLSEKKKIEAELLQYQEQLEEKVDEQTAELRNALQLTEQAMKARSQFLANISHELRTPMNAVLGLTELLLQENLSKKHLDRLKKIKIAGSGLLTLLNDLLDFSKMDADKLTIDEIPFNVTDLIHSIINFLNPEASRKKIDIISKIDKSVPAIIVGDPIRIRQILINLIDNAIKFTETGSIECKVTAMAESPLHLTFTVTDTGIGIPKHVRSYLFEPFKQADSSMTRRSGGTGLGLAICKQLAHLMKGTIGIDETYTQGSRFYFNLPLVTNEQFNQNTVQSFKSPIPFNAGSKQLSGQVLVVEDNDINLEVTSELLKTFGLQVDVARDGIEAVQATLSGHYDLILMDIQMPNMDGYEATRLIRQKNTTIAIIALTAHALASEEQRSLSAGMNDHLSKPIDSRNLYQTIVRWIPQDTALVPNYSFHSIVIPGLDTQNALKRLDYSTSLYRRLLEYFVRDHAKDGYLIKRSIESNDIKRSQYLIHTLKGAASNISATEILTLLNDLSSTLKGDGLNVAKLSESLITSIDNATQSIQEFFETIDSKIQPNMWQTSQIRDTAADESSQLQLLDDLLCSQSFDARRKITLFKDLLDQKSVNLSEQIIDSINHFDYIKARQLLAPYIEREL